LTLGEGAICLLLSLLCGLDRTAAVQSMICRPLTAAALVGWALGLPLVGLEIGVALELVWLGRLPVGAAIPPDDTQMTLAATVLAILGVRQLPEAGAVAPAVGGLLAFCLSFPGRWLDHWARQRNLRLLMAARRAMTDEERSLREISRYHLRGLLHFAGASWCGFLLMVLPGYAVLRLLVGVNLVWAEPVAKMFLLACPLAGMAGILSGWGERSTWRLFSGGFGLVWLVTVVWP